MTGESGTGGKQCGDALRCIGRTDAVVFVSSRVAHERGSALWKQCTTPVSACRYVFLGLTGVYSNKHIVEEKINPSTGVGKSSHSLQHSTMRTILCSIPTWCVSSTFFVARTRCVMPTVPRKTNHAFRCRVFRGASTKQSTPERVNFHLLSRRQWIPGSRNRFRRRQPQLGG